MNPDHLRPILQFFIKHDSLNSGRIILQPFPTFQRETEAIMQQLADENVLEKITVKGAYYYQTDWRLKVPRSELEKLLLLC